MAATLTKSNEDVTDALGARTNSTGGNSPQVHHQDGIHERIDAQAVLWAMVAELRQQLTLPLTLTLANVKKESMQQELIVDGDHSAGSQGFDSEPSGAPRWHQQPVGSNGRVLGRAAQVLGALLPEFEVPVDGCVQVGLCNLMIALFLDQLLGHARLLRRWFVAGCDVVEQFSSAAERQKKGQSMVVKGQVPVCPHNARQPAADGHPALVSQLAFMRRLPLAEGRVALALGGRFAVPVLISSPPPSARRLALSLPDHR